LAHGPGYLGPRLQTTSGASREPRRISAEDRRPEHPPGSRTAEGGPPNQDPGNRAARKGGRRTGEHPVERAAAEHRTATAPTLAANRGEKPRRGPGAEPRGRTALPRPARPHDRDHLDYTADAL